MLRLIVLAACFVCVNPASASLGSLQIWASSNGSAYSLLADVEGNELEFSGMFDVWSVNFVAVSSVNGPPVTSLELNSLQVFNTSTSTATLSIAFSKSGLTFPTTLSAFNLGTGIGGYQVSGLGTTSNVEFEMHVDFQNGPDATDIIAGSDMSSGVIVPPLNERSFNADNTVAGSQILATPFAMAGVVTVEVQGEKKVRYNGSSTAWAVPEPATLGIWSCLGIVAFCGFARRHKRE